eukprot:g8252.t1
MLDRGRLLEIERLANDVLMEQEELRERTRRADSLRQGVAALAPTPGSTSSSSRPQKSDIVRTKNAYIDLNFSPGHEQFLRLGKADARDRLERERIRVLREEKEKRVEVKKCLQKLYEMHPSSQEIPPGVYRLLLEEERREAADKEKKSSPEGVMSSETKKDAAGGGAGAQSGSTSAAGTPPRRDRLDYSQWNSIDTDSSSDEN